MQIACKSRVGGRRVIRKERLERVAGKNRVVIVDRIGSGQVLIISDDYDWVAKTAMEIGAGPTRVKMGEPCPSWCVI